MAKIELPHDHGGNVDIEKLMAHVGGVDRFDEVAELFKQLSDPTRVRIFWLLCHCEECVMNISAIMGMSSPAVSHHLKALKSAGLVSSVREGKEVYYSVPDTPKCSFFHKAIEETIMIACPDD